MTTDTTTTLLVLHERERQRLPRRNLQCQLVNLLAKAAVTSAERDSKERREALVTFGERKPTDEPHFFTVKVHIQPPTNMPNQPVIKIKKFTGTVRFPRKAVQPAFYFRLVAANGEIVAQSEAYTTKAARDKTVALLTKAKIVA